MHGGDPSVCGSAPVTEYGFSADGNSLVFVTTASDLGPQDSNGQSDVYLYDIATDAVELVSHNAAGTDSAAGASDAPRSSPDGTAVAFASTAGDLGPVDDNAARDIYLRNLDTGGAELITAAADGTATGASFLGSGEFSPSGERFVFVRGFANTYVRDLVHRTTELVSATPAGTPGNGLSVGGEFLDEDTVVFGSYATDLGPDDSNSASDIYVRDLASDTTTLLSTRAGGTDGGNAGALPSVVVAPEAGVVVFRTEATDMGHVDENGAIDLYVARYHHHADLALDVIAAPGAGVRYEARVRNDGPDPAVDAALAVLLSDGAEVNSMPDECTVTAGDGTAVLCSLGTLEPGASQRMDFEVQFGSAESDTATFVVTSVVPDTDGDENIVVVEDPFRPPTTITVPAA